MTAYENILVETHGKVGLIRLNRPHALNALSTPCSSTWPGRWTLQADDAIGCIVLTGSQKPAAGADIKEMKDLSFMDVISGLLQHRLDPCDHHPQAGIAVWPVMPWRRLRTGDDVRSSSVPTTPNSANWNNLAPCPPAARSV